jgi:hypothetical protein
VPSAPCWPGLGQIGIRRHDLNRYCCRQRRCVPRCLSSGQVRQTTFGPADTGDDGIVADRTSPKALPATTATANPGDLDCCVCCIWSPTVVPELPQSPGAGSDGPSAGPPLARRTRCGRRVRSDVGLAYGQVKQPRGRWARALHPRQSVMSFQVTCRGRIQPKVALPPSNTACACSTRHTGSSRAVPSAGAGRTSTPAVAALAHDDCAAGGVQLV